jgi:hypothetical protein
MSDSYDNVTASVDNFTVFPDSITSNVTAHYIRYPRDPKRTYVAMGANDSDPLFNPSANDYQDFELPISDFSDLVVKILQYSGMSIREAEVTAAAKSEEMQEIQQKQ